MGKFVVLDHPLIQHKLTIIRRKDTGSNEFRRVVGEIGGLMTYEITRDLPLETCHLKMSKLRHQWVRQFKKKSPVRN